MFPVVKAARAPTGLEGKGLPASEMSVLRPTSPVDARSLDHAAKPSLRRLGGSRDMSAGFSAANLPRQMAPLEIHRAPLQLLPTWRGTGMSEGYASSLGADKAFSPGGGALMATAAPPALAWGGAADGAIGRGALSHAVSSLWAHPGIQKTASLIKNLAMLTPAGRAAGVLVGGALLWSAWRDSGAGRSSEFAPLVQPPHPSRGPQEGFASLPGAGDATIHGGHTRPIPKQPYKEEFLRPSERESDALGLPARPSQPPLPSASVPALPAQNPSLPMLHLAEPAHDLFQERPFAYQNDVEVDLPVAYPLLDGQRVIGQYQVSHRLAWGELAQRPDGSMLVKQLADGLTPLPDGEYYFGSVRGRTGVVPISKNLHIDINPVQYKSAQQVHTFSATQSKQPELWGSLQVRDGRVVSRTNLGGVIRQPSADGWYVNHYPGDAPSGGIVWQLKADAQGGSNKHFVLENKHGLTRSPDGVYSFIQSTQGGLFAVYSNEGWHVDIAWYLDQQQRYAQPAHAHEHRPRGSIPVAFAGDVHFRLGYLDWWNDRTGHFKVSQYHRSGVNLPAGAFRAHHNTYDYRFGPPVNRWYAQAVPVSKP